MWLGMEDRQVAGSAHENLGLDEVGSTGVMVMMCGLILVI